MGGDGGRMRCVLGAAVLAAVLIASSLPAAAESGALSWPRSLGEAWHSRRVLTNPDEGRYVPVLSGAVFNETPQITTEIRPYYLYNSIPHGFLSNGGNINVLGLQARLAVTDRIGVFMSRAGYASAGFDETLPEADGATNVAFGAKYAIIANGWQSSNLTGGLRYEAPAGDIKTGQIELQGGGKGFLDPFVSFGMQLGPRAGVETCLGFYSALDADHDTSSFHSSLHGDVELLDGLFGLLELNVLATIANGDRTSSALFGGFEGYDLFNFGNDDSGTVATASLGMRYRFNEHWIVGSGIEAPLPGRRDLVGFRFLLDVVAHL